MGGFEHGCVCWKQQEVAVELKDSWQVFDASLNGFLLEMESLHKHADLNNFTWKDVNFNNFLLT